MIFLCCCCQSLLLFVDRPLIQNEGQAGQMFGQPSPVCQWPTSVNTSIGKNTYNMLPKYIIRLNYYDRVSTAKAFHNTPNNKSALLLQRECQDSNNQKAMSLYVAINLKKEKKERRRRKILGCSLLKYKTITSFHQTVLCFISSFKSIMRFQKNF